MRLENAWAVLDIDDETINTAVTGGFSYAVVNSRAGGGGAINTAVTHTTEKAAVVADVTKTYPDALSTLLDQPPLGCCKMEQWNKRTFMRTTESISKEFLRICKSKPTYNWGTGLTTYAPVTGMLTCIGDSDRTSTALLA